MNKLGFRKISKMIFLGGGAPDLLRLADLQVSWMEGTLVGPGVVLGMVRGPDRFETAA